MRHDTFRAVIVRDPAGPPRIEELNRTELPAGDVLIDVRFSTLNYKDGLALNDPPKVIRKYPMVPGIDLAGVVVDSVTPQYQAGQHVMVIGCGLGEHHWGGYAQLACVKAEWLLPLPEGLSLKHAMAIGTAGFTAMLCLMALETQGLRPGGRPVVVTGAAGGVGSVAVALLARSGHTVVAATRRRQEAKYLQAIGASEVIGTDELAGTPGKPLLSERWGGAIDTVGGAPLGALFPAMARGASVAACGMAAGTTFQANVLPFILRGVNLLGVNYFVPREMQLTAWQRLAASLPAALLDTISAVAPLEQVIDLSRDILAGRIRGRVVLEV